MSDEIKVWEGKLVLFGAAMRGAAMRGLDSAPGKEIEARIALAEDRLTIERKDGLDGVGAIRWAPVEPREVTQESLARALAMGGRSQ